ncbi:MAG: LysM peptidoglycan-binding domain-containing protein [Verrucomicrobiales bacterium]
MAVAPILFCSCGGLSKSDKETVEILPVRVEAPGEIPAGEEAPAPDAVPETPPEPAAPPYPLETAQKYVIQSGDSLSAISDKFGVSVRDIKAANNIVNVNKIRAGQTLLLPGEDAAVEAEVATPEPGTGDSTGGAAAGGGGASSLELPGAEAGE